MYKDKEKQREANKKAQAKFKAKAKVLPTEGITGGITDTERRYVGKGKGDWYDLANPRRGKDIKRFEDLPPDVQATIIRLTTNPDGTVDKQARTNRTAIAINYQHLFSERFYCTGTGLAPGELIENPIPVRVSKPGDADYNSICTEAWRIAVKGLEYIKELDNGQA